VYALNGIERGLDSALQLAKLTTRSADFHECSK
jgi:hypothetical protein